MSKYMFQSWSSRLYYTSIKDFEHAKKLYESIVPIRDSSRGICRPDTRPINRRDRPWERIVKISRDEYSVTNNWYFHKHCPKVPNVSVLKKLERRVTFKRNGEVAIYPFPAREDKGKVIYCSRYWYPGEINFIDQVLPPDLHIRRTRGKKYLSLPPLEGEYSRRDYLLRSDGPLRFKQIDGVWQVLNPVQEYKYRIDRKASAKVLKKLEPFKKYITAMWHMIDLDILDNYYTNFSSDYIFAYLSSNLVSAISSSSNKKTWLSACIAFKRSYLHWKYDRSTGRNYKEVSISGPEEIDWRPVHKCLQKNHKKIFRSEPVPLGTAVNKHWLET